MFAWLRKLRNRGAVKEPKFVAHEPPKPKPWKDYEDHLAEQQMRARLIQEAADSDSGYGNG